MPFWSLYEDWMSTWSTMPSSLCFSNNEFWAFRNACASNLTGLEFLICRIEADPEFNMPCIAVFNSIYPSKFTNLSMDRAIDIVKTYRQTTPYKLYTLLPKCLNCAGIIAFCGNMYAGKTTAAKMLGSRLYNNAAYNIMQWSFAEPLKRFCFNYFGTVKNTPDASVCCPDVYWQNKHVAPPCVSTWITDKRVTLPSLSVVANLLHHPCISVNAWDSKIKNRLEQVFTADILKNPAKLNGRRIMQVVGSVFRDICGLDFWIWQLAVSITNAQCIPNTIHVIDDVRFPNEAAWLLSVGAFIIHIDNDNSQKTEFSEHVSESFINSLQSDITIHRDQNKLSDPEFIAQLLPIVLNRMCEHKIISHHNT